MQLTVLSSNKLHKTMTRNIIFRGREPQSGVWHTGSLVANDHAALIVNLSGTTIDAIEVDPDTVQQMTNCYHHGRYVWEGDVFATHARPGERYTVYYDIVRDEFRIRWSDSKTTSTAPLVAFLAECPEMIYMGNIIDLTDNTDKP